MRVNISQHVQNADIEIISQRKINVTTLSVSNKRDNKFTHPRETK